MVWSFLNLFSFIYSNAVKIHHVIDYISSSFFLLIVFQHLDTPQIVEALVSQRVVGFFQFGANMNKSINIHMQVFVLIYFSWINPGETD